MRLVAALILSRSPHPVSLLNVSTAKNNSSITHQLLKYKLTSTLLIFLPSRYLLRVAIHKIFLKLGILVHPKL